MPAAAGAATQRVINRVHRLAAHMATPAHPAGTTSLADRHVHIVGVRYCADRCLAAAVHQALLARIQTQDHVLTVAADDLRISAGGTRDLTALADLDLDIVDNSADRNIG